MIRIALDPRQLLALQDRLSLLTLSPKKRYQLMNRVGRAVAKATRTRIRAMKAPDDTPWAPVKSKRKPVRIKRMAKRLQSRATANSAVLSFGGPYASVIPPRLHQGETVQHHAPPSLAARERPPEKGKKRETFEPTDSPCTRRQAIKLRKLGYRILSKRGKRTRWRNPSISWLQEHVSRPRAGIIIRALSGQARKTSWSQATPARPLLHKASDKELLAICAKAFADAGWTGKG